MSTTTNDNVSGYDYYDDIFAFMLAKSPTQQAVYRANNPILSTHIPLAPFLDKLVDSEPTTTARDMVADIVQADMTVRIQSPDGSERLVTGKPISRRTTRFGLRTLEEASDKSDADREKHVKSLTPQYISALKE